MARNGENPANRKLDCGRFAPALGWICWCLRLVIWAGEGFPQVLWITVWVILWQVAAAPIIRGMA